MKFSSILIALACSSQTPVVPRATHGAEEEDYYVGRMIGLRLTAKCQIFRGLLVAPLSLEGGASVMVAEQMFGPRCKSQIVKIPFADPDGRPPSPEQLNSAWRRAPLSTNPEGTVLPAVEQIPYIKAGNPIAVTSNEHVVALIRSLIAEAARIERSPSGLTGAADRNARSRMTPARCRSTSVPSATLASSSGVFLAA